MDPVTTLKLVLNTLNTIEVKGSSNLNALLGSIQTLERVVQQLEAPKQEVKTDGR